MCLSLMVLMSIESVLMGLLMVGLFVGWYKAYAQKGAKTEGEVMRVVEDMYVQEATRTIQSTIPIKKRVLVPVSNEQFEGLKVQLAALMTGGNGNIIRLQVIVIPNQTSYENALEYVEKAHIEEMEELRCQERLFPGHREYHQLLSHDYSGTVIDAVRKEKCDLLVIGEPQQRFNPSRTSIPLTKMLLHGAGVDTAVLSVNRRSWRPEPSCGEWRPKRILVPFDENPHTILALEFARNISLATGATLILLFVSLQKNLKETEEKAHRLIQDISSTGMMVESRIIIGRSPSKTVIDLSGEYDLIVMGASRTWILRKFLLGAIPDRVISKALCPVLVARKWEGALLSTIKGWFGR